MSRDPIHIDIDPVLIPDESGKYSEYPLAFRTNEKNPKIIVFKKQGETSTELDWIIVPLDEERTLWTFKTIHYWDYTASEYDFYYESDTCERYLIETFLRSENFEKPFDGEQITYNNVTYNLAVDRYHDCISNIIYPDNTQYNIVDNSAVHLTGADDIYGEKTFNDKVTVNDDHSIAGDLQVYKNIRQSRSGLTKGTNPSDSYYMGLIYDDGSPYPSGQEYSNENRFGLFETCVDSNGNVATYMSAYKNEVNGGSNSQIRIVYPVSGDPYATCPTPTENTTSSNQIDTVGARNSKLLNYLTTNTDQAYSGVKTHDITVSLNQQNWVHCEATRSNVDATSAPTYQQQFYTDAVVDKNGNYLSWITTTLKTNKGVHSSLSARCKNTANSANVTADISLNANPDGTTWVTCPGSDVGGSIVTTVNKSKATNGYFQYGNGMIVNWGTSGTLSECGSLTITLSKAFTSTNYSVTANYKVQHTASDAEGAITVDNFTKTTFRLSGGYLNPNSGTVSWIAIGY